MFQLTPKIRFGNITFINTDRQNIQAIQLLKDSLSEASSAKNELSIGAARGLHPDLPGDNRPPEAIHITGPDAWDFFQKEYKIHPALIPAGDIKPYQWLQMAQISPGIKQFIVDMMAEMGNSPIGPRPVTNKLFHYLQTKKEQPIEISQSHLQQVSPIINVTV